MFAQTRAAYIQLAQHYKEVLIWAVQTTAILFLLLLVSAYALPTAESSFGTILNGVQSTIFTMQNDPTYVGSQNIYTELFTSNQYKQSLYVLIGTFAVMLIAFYAASVLLVVAHEKLFHLKVNVKRVAKILALWIGIFAIIRLIHFWININLTFSALPINLVIFSMTTNILIGFGIIMHVRYSLKEWCKVTQHINTFIVLLGVMWLLQPTVLFFFVLSSILAFVILFLVQLIVTRKLPQKAKSKSNITIQLLLLLLIVKIISILPIPSLIAWIFALSMYVLIIKVLRTEKVVTREA